MYHIDIYDKNKHCSGGGNGIKLVMTVELLDVKTHKEDVISQNNN